MSGPSRHIASPHDLGRGKARNWSSRDSGTQSAVRPGARSAPRSRMRARSITGLARCYRRNARLTFQVPRQAVVFGLEPRHRLVVLFSFIDMALLKLLLVRNIGAPQGCGPIKRWPRSAQRM